MNSVPQPPQQPDPPPAGKQPMFRFGELAQGFREILIEHQGQIYRLRVTRNDKLILQK